VHFSGFKNPLIASMIPTAKKLEKKKTENIWEEEAVNKSLGDFPIIIEMEKYITKDIEAHKPKNEIRNTIGLFFWSNFGPKKYWEV
jgi:hypothetical protein